LEIFIKKDFCLKLSKYNFYIKEIIFLGYIIILGTINLDPKRIQVIIIQKILIIIKQIFFFRICEFLQEVY
jgi:hypothetical protein